MTANSEGVRIISLDRQTERYILEHRREFREYTWLNLLHRDLELAVMRLLQYKGKPVTKFVIRHALPDTAKDKHVFKRLIRLQVVESKPTSFYRNYYKYSLTQHGKDVLDYDDFIKAKAKADLEPVRTP